jgi:hypothetical protein
MPPSVLEVRPAVMHLNEEMGYRPWKASIEMQKKL